MNRSVLFGVATALAGLSAAGAASAQSYPDYRYQGSAYSDGITVYGRAPSATEPYSLSQTVSYADLDLSTRAGLDTLRWRIGEAAKSLCTGLGERPESEQNTAVLPSCQASARETTTGQVRRAVDRARYTYAYGYYR
jgi:UrcA family protein